MRPTFKPVFSLFGTEIWFSCPDHVSLILQKLARFLGVAPLIRKPPRATKMIQAIRGAHDHKLYIPSFLSDALLEIDHPAAQEGQPP